MALIGDTGTGKSTLMARLSLHRSYLITVRTKPDDVKWPGKVVREVSQIQRKLTDTDSDRWVLDLSSKSAKPNFDFQRAQIAQLFERAWNERGWTLALDETYYIDKVLNLRQNLNWMLTQGRSVGITLMMGIQRPTDISRFVMSSSTHTIVFRQDGRDARTVSEACAFDLRPVLTSLPPHYFAWYYRPGRKLFTGTLNPETGTLEGSEQATEGDNAGTLARKR